MLDCKSPFEITRIRLLQQLSLMQTRFLKSSAKTRSNIISEGTCILSFYEAGFSAGTILYSE